MVLSYEVLKEFPMSYTGLQTMKVLARSHVWWPKMDYNILELLKSCWACQEVKQAPTVAPLQPWVSL